MNKVKLVALMTIEASASPTAQEIKRGASFEADPEQARLLCNQGRAEPAAEKPAGKPSKPTSVDS